MTCQSLFRKLVTKLGADQRYFDSLVSCFPSETPISEGLEHASGFLCNLQTVGTVGILKAVD